MIGPVTVTVTVIAHVDVTATVTEPGTGVAETEVAAGIESENAIRPRTSCADSRMGKNYSPQYYCTGMQDQDSMEHCSADEQLLQLQTLQTPQV